MKDQQAIIKLQLLKNMQPNKHILKDIKEGVYQQMQAEKKTQSHLRIPDRISTVSALIKSYDVSIYAGGVALLIVIFLAVSVMFFPNQTHSAILLGRLALAPNKYEKARIALNDTKSSFVNSKILQLNTTELAYSLTLTNTQLNSLKLKGEEGKYTAQECHQIYQEYLTYLESKAKIIPLKSTILKSEINSYEEQAEKKLHMYNSL